MLIARFSTSNLTLSIGESGLNHMHACSVYVNHANQCRNLHMHYSIHVQPVH